MAKFTGFGYGRVIFVIYTRVRARVMRGGNLGSAGIII